MVVFSLGTWQYSKNPRLRTWEFRNLLPEICIFNTPKYKNLFSQTNSNRFLFVGFNYLICIFFTKNYTVSLINNFINVVVLLATWVYIIKYL